MCSDCERLHDKLTEMSEELFFLKKEINKKERENKKEKIKNKQIVKKIKENKKIKKYEKKKGEKHEILG